jgi:exodeoxyribonuclease VIII
MLDLETWGNGNNARIISIGAVKFDPNLAHEIQEAFYVAVEPESYPRVPGKFEIDASTIKWWMADEQKNARNALARDEKVDAGVALTGFVSWFGSESLPVWGNGSTFDNVILRNSLEAYGIEPPWKFWHDRCFRTFKNLAPAIKAEPVGIVHHALHDAQSQAYQLQAITQHMGLVHT